MSLRIPQSAVLKTEESMQPHSEIFNPGYTEVKESLPSAVDLDSTAAVLVPELAFLPYPHSTKDASDVSSPSSSLPPVVEDGKMSTMTHSSEGDTANDVVLDRLKWRLASGFFAYFMCGWGDGVTGTVLPYFMADFHIGFMMSSLLYAATTVGFMVGTFLVESIVNRLGCFDLASTHSSWIPRIRFISVRKQGNKKIGYSPSQARHVALLISSILHGMFFVMMGSRGGFWVAFGAYALAAFARSILTGDIIVIISKYLAAFHLLINEWFRNAYFASGPQQSLGYAFGLWSLGSVASPLLCQSLIAINVPWFKFYFGSLVLSGINVAFLVLTFKPTKREFMRDRQNAFIVASKSEHETASTKHVPSVKDIDTEYMPASDCPPENIEANKKGTPSTFQYITGTDDLGAALSTALKLRYLWAVCVFTNLYYGCETSTQGFIVSYLLGTRNANPKTVGYVTSGFWGGITIGRFVWGHLTPKLDYTQRKTVVQVCILIGFTMQILIWTIDSNLENSVSTSVIGLVYGPVFPASLTLANDMLPLEVRMISMALISASASFGSALFPFIAGTVSSLEGVHTLTYITVPLAGTLACLWTLFPSKIPSRPDDAA